MGAFEDRLAKGYQDAQGAAESKAQVAGPGEPPLWPDDFRLHGGNRWLNRHPYSSRRAIVSNEETVLEEAQRLVQGPRQSNYSHPSQDFKATGRQWGAILENWLKSEGYAIVRNAGGDDGDMTVEEWEDADMPDIPPRIVALLMVNLKLSRESHKPKRDNRVDGAGYLLCADMVIEGDDNA